MVLTLLMAVFMAQGGVDAGQAVREFATGGSVDSTNVAVLIMDLKGNVLGEHNADRAMTPASVMKCVTTATLLEAVGTDWRYETPVYVTGPVKDGVLDGNVVVVGSGDPSVNSRHVEGENIVDQIINALKDAGIDTIRGRVTVDESRFAGPAINPRWASGDLPNSYGTGSHGFNFEDNASGKASVKDPAAVFLSRLRVAMQRHGITMLGNALEDGRRRLLGTHRSATIDEIMRSCMMRSDNQYAEALLRTVSAHHGKDGSTQSGADMARDYWKHRKLPMQGVEIFDGSGLSRSDRLTARFLGGVLSRMAPNPYYASFFPLAGQEGTLKRFLAGTPLEGYVAMKTGSMNGIQCYAGYKLDDNYAPTHVIVVMINNMANRGRARDGVRRMLEQIFIENYERVD